MAKRKQTEYIQGHATHRRTEGDYMGVLLDAVTLDDWRGVVTGALQAAKGGDPQARNWLAQYLVGRPEGKAPTPLNIVVQQLNGVRWLNGWQNPSFTNKPTRHCTQMMLMKPIFGHLWLLNCWKKSNRWKP